MKKIVVMILFCSVLFANEFSKMSTQELISIMGYVDDSKQVQFLRELKTRTTYMDQKTKKMYKKNLKKYYTNQNKKLNQNR